MASARKEEMAEIDPVDRALELAARKRGLRDLQQAFTPLCCIVDTVGQELKQLRRCHDCNSYMCKAHMGFMLDKYVCSRCTQIRLLFPDFVGEPDVDRKRQEVPQESKESDSR